MFQFSEWILIKLLSLAYCQTQNRFAVKNPVVNLTALKWSLFPSTSGKKWSFAKAAGEETEVDVYHLCLEQEKHISRRNKRKGSGTYERCIYSASFWNSCYTDGKGPEKQGSKKPYSKKKNLNSKDYAVVQWDDLIRWSFISSSLQIELLKHFDE